MDGRLPPYEIIRSKRKTVSLRIEKDLRVTVRCPLRMPKGEIERFVETHSQWLERHLERMSQEQREKEPFSFQDGQKVYLLGRAYSIETAEEGPEGQFRENRLLLRPGTPIREQAVMACLRQEAAEHLRERVRHYGAVMGLAPASVKITGAKTRWGSCSGRGGICFSWRLICLPEHLVDYVVVHELAHLVEHNHSQRFYRLVERYLPDYRTCRQQIAQWQKKLPL